LRLVPVIMGTAVRNVPVVRVECAKPNITAFWHIVRCC